MIKRKAEDCVDCWVRREIPSSQSDLTNTAAIGNGVTTPALPKAEPTPVEVARQPNIPHTADVAALEDTLQGRFWLLLERVGYEVW